MPDDVTPTPAAAGFLTPAMRRYLLLIGVSLASLFLGRLLPGWTPPPPPDDLFGEVKRIGAAVQRIESQQVQVMRAAGVPPQ